VLKEFGISDEFTQNVFPIDSSVNKELQTFVLQELRGPSSILFVFILFGPVVLLLIVNQLTFLKRWIVDFWMSPIYRAWTLRGISEVLQSDERLVSVLRESSKIHPLNGLRKRISRLVGNIESGMAVQDAFHRSGLISRSQRELIALAKKPSQLAWTLRQIADRNFFRWIEWYSMCMDVFALLMVLVTAVVVGFFAYIQFQLFAYVITWGAR
jgi:type II secretory pathway component PulF